MTTTTSEQILVDDYSQGGWLYELLYAPEGNEITIRVTGSEKGESFVRLFAPPAEHASKVFKEPFRFLRYEIKS